MKKNRQQWISQIEKHQPFSQNKKNYNVCIRHFLESDYEKKNDKFTLHPNALPSIFDIIKSDDFVEIISNELIDEAEPDKCVQCPCLLKKIKKLEDEIMRIKTEHCVSMAKVELKNTVLKNRNLEKSKQLRESQKEKSKLKDVLDEIRLQNYISDSEREFLNVITF